MLTWFSGFSIVFSAAATAGFSQDYIKFLSRPLVLSKHSDFLKVTHFSRDELVFSSHPLDLGLLTFDLFAFHRALVL